MCLLNSKEEFEAKHNCPQFQCENGADITTNFYEKYNEKYLLGVGKAVFQIRLELKLLWETIQVLFFWATRM